MTPTDEVTALARGNAVLAELGIPACTDVAELARTVRRWHAGFAAGSRKLTGVQEMLAAGRRRPAPDLKIVQERILSLLEARAPLPRQQIVEALADEISEARVRAQIWCLSNQKRSIVSSPEGWRLRHQPDQHTADGSAG